MKNMTFAELVIKFFTLVLFNLLFFIILNLNLTSYTKYQSTITNFDLYFHNVNFDI